MQTRYLVLALAAGSLIGLVAGCERKTEPPPAPPAKAEAGTIQQQVGTAAAAAKETAQQAATAVTGAATQAATAVSSAATQAVQAAAQPATDATAKAQAIIDSAKKLVSESKWQEVAQTLGQLKDLKLTPDQEKSLMDLKAQLEKMVKDAMSKQPALPGGVVPGK